MSRIRHIDTRNLVVAETFDDFAKKVEQTDFLVEDIVGYVINVTNVFYWLNVESVWGVIGFNWVSTEEMADEEMLRYPNPWRHLEHVNAAGENIENPNKKVVRGWGRFTRTTLPFSIIPKLPDGHRITAFNDTFQGIESNTIELQGSTWDNLTSLTNFCPENKRLDANLTGAPIDTVGGVLIGKRGTLYVIGDFSRLGAINFGGTYVTWSTYNQYTANNNNIYRQILEVNDDNKYLNFSPIRHSTASTTSFVIRWKGEGAWKDEYMYRDIDENSNYGFYTSVSSDNYNVELVNLASGGHRLATRPITEGFRLGLNFTQNWEASSNNITVEEPITTLTIDTSICQDIDLGHILCYTLGSTDNMFSKLYNLNKIEYKGSVNSINAYLPYVNLANGYPVFEANIVNKLVSEGWVSILDYPQFVNKLIKCPYTINISNFESLSMRMLSGTLKSRYTLDECQEANITQFEGNTYIVDVLPTLTGTSHTLSNLVLSNTTVAGNGFTAYYKIPSLKTTRLVARGFYLDANTIIECSTLTANIGGSTYDKGNYLIDDLSKTHIRLVPNLNGVISFDKQQTMNVHSKNTSNDGYNPWTSQNVNFISIDYDRDVLKASVIDTSHVKPNNGYSYLQPFIVSNINDSTEFTAESPSSHAGWTFNPSFIYIYRQTIVFNRTTNTGNFSVAQVRQIINSIEPNDSNDRFEIIVRDWLYNEIQDMEDYITKSVAEGGLNYILTPRS